MKKINLLVTFLLIVIRVQSQDLLGIRSSNYAGLNAIELNPSLIVDSRLKWDINISSFGVNLENNYVFVAKDSLKFFGVNNIIDRINNKGYQDNISKDKKFLRFSQFYMGPSVMFPITRKHSIAFTAQERFGISINNVDFESAKYAYEGLGYDPLHFNNTQQFYNFSGAKLNLMTWFEYNLTYATILKETEISTLKAGVTLKYLLGHTAAYVNNTSLSYNALDDSTALFVQGSVDYGRVSYDIYDDFSTSNLFNGTGFGGNLGFTWELHKDPTQYNMMIDGEKYVDPTLNKYKIKLGLSVVDIGRINFNKNANTFQLAANNSVYPNWNTDEFDSNDDFDKSMSFYFYGDSLKSLRNNSFTMNLPTGVSFQADFNIYKSFYVAAVGTFNIKTKGPGIDRPDIISVTPRFESKWFEAAIPISYYIYNDYITNVGLALRLGKYIWIGSDKLGTMMGLSDMYGADVYGALKVGLSWKKVKDSDNDRVSDKKDICPEIPGLFKFNGCPDKDGDGIEDKKDKCPDIAGLEKFMGCPDSDNDGIIDLNDDCPTDSGLVEFSGCPDRDGDKVIDKRDSCVDVAGLVEFDGCPDTDKDSIIDSKDDCPDVFGLLLYNGCPDTDGDGIIDSKDRCPQEKGTIELNGCPPIIEKVEIKKSETVEIKLTTEMQNVINKVFTNLKFEIGKSIIQKVSFASLNQLVELLKEHPEFRLSIKGHTDNTGVPAKNLNLSKDRANTVKKYLMNSGINVDRIIAEGFGSTQPISPNTTIEGKAQNRRVEFKIIE